MSYLKNFYKNREIYEERQIACKLIGTVISGFLRFLVVIRPLPRITTVFAPRTTDSIRIFRQRRHAKFNISLFLPSSPDLRQSDKGPRYTSPTKPYKHRFRGVILFRINFVFEYYTDTSARTGGERAYTVTG